MIQVIAPLIITALPPPAPPKWESRYRCQPARVKVLGRYWNWKQTECCGRACSVERTTFMKKWKETQARSKVAIDLSGIAEFLSTPSSDDKSNVGVEQADETSI